MYHVEMLAGHTHVDVDFPFRGEKPERFDHLVSIHGGKFVKHGMALNCGVRSCSRYTYRFPNEAIKHLVGGGVLEDIYPARYLRVDEFCRLPPGEDEGVACNVLVIGGRANLIEPSSLHWKDFEPTIPPTDFENGMSWLEKMAREMRLPDVVDKVYSRAAVPASADLQQMTVYDGVPGFNVRLGPWVENHLRMDRHGDYYVQINAKPEQATVRFMDGEVREVEHRSILSLQDGRWIRLRNAFERGLVYRVIPYTLDTNRYL